jgi:hypothetical protein
MPRPPRARPAARRGFAHTHLLVFRPREARAERFRPSWMPGGAPTTSCRCRSSSPS